MSICSLISITIAALMMAAQARAQDNTASGGSSPDEIFNSIMQTMPEGMKARIDSAASFQHGRNTAKVEPAPRPDEKGKPSADSETRQAGMDRLPEAVREQVRRTMRELENENIERMLQFKEIKSRRNENQ